MNVRLYLPAFLLALCTSTLATTSSVPATVVVAFNRTSVLPVIVEGAADRATGRQVSANDPVRIASISKLIMALATLRLVDEGRVALNVDVSDYLGWSLRSPYYPTTPVTLAQLLSHRAGLRDDVGYVVALDTRITDELFSERLAREVVRRIQTLRRDANFDIDDRIHVIYSASERIQQAIQQFGDYIRAETLAESLAVQVSEDGFYSENFTFKRELEAESLTLGVKRID